MPHCERDLYEWMANRRKDEWIVIGNSINEYIERAKMLSEEVIAFKGLKPSEKKLKDYKEAFNDTFVY